MPTTKEQFCKVHNGTDPIVHCVKGEEPTLLCTVSKVIFIQNRKKAFQYR